MAETTLFFVFSPETMLVLQRGFSLIWCLSPSFRSDTVNRSHYPVRKSLPSLASCELKIPIIVVVFALIQSLLYSPLYFPGPPPVVGPAPLRVDCEWARRLYDAIHCCSAQAAYITRIAVGVVLPAQYGPDALHRKLHISQETWPLPQLVFENATQQC